MTSADTATIKEAALLMRRGCVIAYPTEAVYGLGCDPFNADAITKLLQLKHRSLHQGFILVAENWEQLEPLVQPIEPAALYQVLETWPGPVTWLFPARPIVPNWIKGEHSSIAVRVSNHRTVKALCHAFDGPIVSTSANIHGQPAIRDYRTVKMTFGDKLDMVLEGKVGPELKPTMIKDAVTGEVIRP